MAANGLQLRLTPLAQTDLENIWFHTFELGSIDQANRYHRDLIGTVEALAQGDKTGRICTLREGYLQYAVGSHIVCYRETETTFDFSRVLHQRMDIDRHP